MLDPSTPHANTHPKSKEKTLDISDATIVSETQAAASAPVMATVETLDPIAPPKAASTLKDKLQAAAAQAAMNAVQNAAHQAFQPRPARPNWAFATHSSAHLIALGFGSGLMRPAPGTWGTLFGWVTFNYLLAGLSAYTQGAIILAAFVVGIWACGTAGKALGVIDHGAWVWDEVVAFWLILWLVPHSFAAQMWAFVLFRFFDIVKPPPIRQWDAQLKNGFGVMWDDIMAAFYTLLLISLWNRIFV
jgi:phosphatidylglycerophosphatase A